MNVLVFDTEYSIESSNPNNNKFMLSLLCCIFNDRVFSFWFNHIDEQPTGKAIQKFQHLINKSDIIVAHNLKNDLNIMRYFGCNFENKQLWCTQVVEYLIRGHDKQIRYSLDKTTERYGIKPKQDVVKELYWNKGIDTYDVPASILQEYCINDCNITKELYLKQKEIVQKNKLNRVTLLQNKFIFSLSDMELNGILFDVDKALEYEKQYRETADRCTKKIAEYVGDSRINLSSSKQLSAILFGGILKVEYKKWVIKTYKTKPYSTYSERTLSEEYHYDGLGFKPLEGKNKIGCYSVDKNIIKKLRAPTKKLKEIKRILIEYSKVVKAADTIKSKNGKRGLTKKVYKNGKLYPSFNQTVTATGRLSSSNPSGHTFPRSGTSPIKECIIPENGFDFIGQVDLSQIEWRVAAELSGDKTMIQEINDGIDQHAAAVKDIMKLKFTDKNDPVSKKNRTNAKVLNFRYIYGGTKWGFYLDPDMPDFTLKRWETIINELNKKYSGFKRWQDLRVSEALKTGRYTLPTGRWFKYLKTLDKDGVMVYKQNQPKNYPIQGLAGGDILPMMCVVIRNGMKKLNLKSKLILTVHDSIVFMIVESELYKLANLCYTVGNNLDKYIKNYYKIPWSVKIECEFEYGKNYGEMKELTYEDCKDGLSAC